MEHWLLILGALILPLVFIAASIAASFFAIQWARGV